MPIFKWSGNYFYGYFFPHEKPEKIVLWTYIEEKGEKYKFRKKLSRYYRGGFFYEKDPIGNILARYEKSISLEEQEDPELPKKYPGKYYWVWYNGAFFEVMGETEKYIRVEVGVWRYDQADALGIDRKKVEAERFESQDVPYWWFRKSDVKMPDEFGKGKYIYLNLGGYYRPGVYAVVRRKGKYIRVRGRKVYDRRKIDRLYEEIKEYIENGLFPMGRTYKFMDDVRKEMNTIINKEAEPDMWRPSEDELFYEVTFDLEKLRKYRVMRDSKQHPYLDFYLYGEEDVPYRL